MKKYGVVAIVGSPNAGKSTLLNNLIGAKIAIVSPKVQTTRSTMKGIAVKDNSQIVFLDTPGIFRPERKLEKTIVKHAWSGAHEADVILLLIDATRGVTENDEMIIRNLAKEEVPVYVAINKVDAVKKEKLFGIAEKLASYNYLREIFMISAFKGDKVESLTTLLFDAMPEGDWQFSEEDLTDSPMKYIAQEFTREQIFNLLDRELPYNIAVETEKWETEEDGRVVINQVIYVTKESQKAIVLGKGGSMVKKIGMNARRNISALLGVKVSLYLFVKVKENWVEDPDLCI